jgi:hypothetical protein
MPIVTARNQVGLNAAPSARREFVRPTGLQSIGQGVVDAGQAIDQVRREEQLKADRAAFMEADLATDTLANELYSSAQSKIGKDAIGVSPTLLADFDKRSGEILTGLKNDRQKETYTQAVNAKRSQLQRQLDSHEGRERETYYAQTREAYKQQAQVNAVTSYQDPDAVEAQIANIGAAVRQTPGLDDAQRESEIAALRSDTYAGVIDRYLANNQLQGAEKYYKAVKSNVNGDVATRIESRLQAERDRMKAQQEANLSLARAELQDEVRNIEAAAKMRIPVTNVPNEARFVALYGERGKQMHQQVQSFAALSVDAARLDQMPSAEIVSLAEGYRPTKVEGAAAQAELAGVIQQQANEVLNDRAKDPVGYLQAYSPTVRDAVRVFSEAPSDESRRTYLDALRGERQRLQIPGDDILSRQDAAAVVDRMTRFDDTQKLTDSIRGEATRWGADWPLVFAQVGDKLPDTAFFIGTGLTDKASAVVGATVGITDDELKKRLPVGTTIQNVKDDVRQDLDDFAASFPIEGSAAVDKVLTGTEKLTLGYLGQGMSYRDARRAAVAETTSKYQFLTYRDRTYRVPREIDASQIDDGATSVLRNLKIPERLIPPGATEEQVARTYKNRAYWVTNEDETGLILFAEGAPVGNPPAFRYTWDQLKVLGIQAAPTPAEIEQMDRATGSMWTP